MPKIDIPIPQRFFTSVNKFTEDIRKFTTMTEQINKSMNRLNNQQVNVAQNQVTSNMRRLYTIMNKSEAVLKRTLDATINMMGTFGKYFMRGLGALGEIVGLISGPVGWIITGTVFVFNITTMAASFMTSIGKWVWDKMVGLGDSMLKDFLEATGADATVGGLRAFRAAFRGLPDDPNIIGNIGRGKYDATTKQFLAMKLLGVKRAKDTADMATQTVLAAAAFMKAQPKGISLVQAAALGLTSVFTPEFLMALRNADQKELQQMADNYARYQEQFKLSDAAVEGWMHFRIQIDATAGRIQKILAEKLADPNSGLMSSLTKLSDAFVQFVQKFMDTPQAKQGVDTIVEWLKGLVSWIESGKAKKALQDSIKVFKEIIKQAIYAGQQIVNLGKVFLDGVITPAQAEEIPASWKRPVHAGETGLTFRPGVRTGDSGGGSRILGPSPRYPTMQRGAHTTPPLGRKLPGQPRGPRIPGQPSGRPSYKAPGAPEEAPESIKKAIEGGYARVGGGVEAVGGGGEPYPRMGEIKAATKDQLMKEGLTPEQAEAGANGLVGQAIAESRLNSVFHDQGKVQGRAGGYVPSIYGADHTRGQAMVRWIQAQGGDPNDTAWQGRFMAHEVMTGRYSRSQNAIRNGNPDEIADALTQEYEAPASRNSPGTLAERRRNARIVAGTETRQVDGGLGRYTIDDIQRGIRGAPQEAVPSPRARPGQRTPITEITTERPRTAADLAAEWKSQYGTPAPTKGPTTEAARAKFQTTDPISGPTSINELEHNAPAQAAISRFTEAFPNVPNPKTQIYSLVAGESNFGRDMGSGKYRGYFQLGDSEAYNGMGLTGAQFSALPFDKQMDAYTDWAKRSVGDKLTNLGVFNAASAKKYQTLPDETVVYPAGTAAANANRNTWGRASNADGDVTIGGIKAYYGRNDEATNRAIAEAAGVPPPTPAVSNSTASSSSSMPMYNYNDLMKGPTIDSSQIIKQAARPTARESAAQTPIPTSGAPSSLPVKTGPIGDQSSRPSQYTNTVTIDGQDYPFTTGGNFVQKGRVYESAPYGRWQVTPEVPLGSVGNRMAAGGNVPINLNAGMMADPKLQRDRGGIYFHGQVSSMTLEKEGSEGCIVIPRDQYPAFRQAVLDKIKRDGPQDIVIGPDGHIQFANRGQPVNQPVPSSAERTPQGTPVVPPGTPGSPASTQQGSTAPQLPPTSDGQKPIMYGFKGKVVDPNQPGGAWDQQAFERTARAQGYEPRVIENSGTLSGYDALSAAKKDWAASGKPPVGFYGFSKGTLPASLAASDPDFKPNTGKVITVGTYNPSVVAGLKGNPNWDNYPDYSSGGSQPTGQGYYLGGQNMKDHLTDMRRVADTVDPSGGQQQQPPRTAVDDSLEGRQRALDSVKSQMEGAGLTITSTYRDPNDVLSRKNPRSAHTQARAFDTHAQTTDESDAAQATIREQLNSRGLQEGRDYTILDEVRHPSRWATGPHVHTQFTPEGMRRYQESLDNPPTQQSPTSTTISQTGNTATRTSVDIDPNWVQEAIAKKKERGDDRPLGDMEDPDKDKQDKERKPGESEAAKDPNKAKKSDTSTDNKKADADSDGKKSAKKDSTPSDDHKKDQVSVQNHGSPESDQHHDNDNNPVKVENHSDNDVHVSGVGHN